MATILSSRWPSSYNHRREESPPQRRNGRELRWASTGEQFLSVYLRTHANLCSIYKEIGPGERIAFAKLAIDKFEETGRPFRIAIDVSIWLFQIQASKGNSSTASSPAIHS
jgi:hypothetical protein